MQGSKRDVSTTANDTMTRLSLDKGLPLLLMISDEKCPSNTYAKHEGRKPMSLVSIFSQRELWMNPQSKISDAHSGIHPNKREAVFQ